jgi:hypothetical protein
MALPADSRHGAAPHTSSSAGAVPASHLSTERTSAMALRHALLAAAAVSASAASPAQTWTLDFGNSPADVPAACATSSGAPRTCGNYAPLLATYGDVAGIVDVTTRAAHGGPLQWFSSGYNELYGVAFDNLPSHNGPLSIDLVPLNGGVLTLSHFELGGYFHNERRDVELQIFAIGNATPLFSRVGSIGSSGSASDSGQHSDFDLGLSSASGLRIQWNDPANTSNTGIDNIVFSVTPTAPVPEPSSAALLLAGLLPLGAWLARRRAAHHG